MGDDAYNRNNHGHTANTHACDEPTGKSGVGTSSRDGNRLDTHAENEDTSGNDDPELAGEVLGDKRREQSTDPSAELEDGSEPALLGLVGIVVKGIILAHVWKEDVVSDTLPKAYTRTVQWNSRSLKEGMARSPENMLS